MEKMVYLFEDRVGDGRALSTHPSGEDLRDAVRWSKSRDIRLNRPKLAEVGARDVEAALSLLNEGKPYYFNVAVAPARGLPVI